MKKGDRVIMCGHHSWAGESGTYLEDRLTVFGARPVIRLDSGIEVFVMWPNQVRVIKAYAKKEEGK